MSLEMNHGQILLTASQGTGPTFIASGNVLFASFHTGSATFRTAELQYRIKDEAGVYSTWRDTGFELTSAARIKNYGTLAKGIEYRFVTTSNLLGTTVRGYRRVADVYQPSVGFVSS